MVIIICTHTCIHTRTHKHRHKNNVYVHTHIYIYIYICSHAVTIFGNTYSQIYKCFSIHCLWEGFPYPAEFNSFRHTVSTSKYMNWIALVSHTLIVPPGPHGLACPQHISMSPSHVCIYNWLWLSVYVYNISISTTYFTGPPKDHYNISFRKL